MSESAAVSTPLLSVVVIGRNEGERLTRCLQSVRAMADPGGPVEVIYVDSDSRDDSVARARALDVEVIAVKPERPSAALGRNAGWRVARAPYVLFLDGDTILHPDFVAQSMPEFADEKVAVVWGHRREIHPEQSLFNRVLDLDWVYAPGVSEFCGGDAIMRRAVLEDVGGFDASLIAGEEPELCQRMRAQGHVILHVDRPMTGHDLAMTSGSAYWRRAFRAGYAYAEVSEKLKDGPFPLWRREVQRNRVHALVLLGAVLGGVGLAVLLEALWPALLPVAFIAALGLRSACKNCWKAPDDIATMILYGFHSHLQQIPIFVGQCASRWDAWRKRRRLLIEYK
jgi:cellulose synthase/poly-beta-1,6-N-acetylglucosamine synthase-like glycosyltransferase